MKLREELKEALQVDLEKWCKGDESALESILEKGYREIFITIASKKIFGLHITIEPEDLVHDLYLKLQRVRDRHFKNKDDDNISIDVFLRFVDKMMTQIAIDKVRYTQRTSRGGRSITLNIEDLNL